MNSRLFSFLTLFLTMTGIFSFPVSVYLGSGTNDPDIYEFFGWFASIGLLSLAFICGVVSLTFWFSERERRLAILMK